MSQSWSNFGSTYAVPELTEFIRHAAQESIGFAQAVNPPTGKALGKRAGEQVQYTFFPNLSTAGGVLDENEEIPTGSLVPVISNSVLQEYGNGTGFTGKLQALSQLPFEDGLVQALINDMKKAQNTAAHAEFDATDWIVNFSAAGDEFATDGDPTGFSNATDEVLTLANMRYLVRQAEKNNIPYFDGESYLYITGVDSLDQLSFDSDVSTLLSRDSGRAALNGEVGRIVSARLLKDNHITSKAGTSDDLDTGYLIGADAVTNEYAIAPEIRAEDKDVGRSMKVVWYFIASWKKIYSQDLHGREHVIKVAGKPA